MDLIWISLLTVECGEGKIVRSNNSIFHFGWVCFISKEFKLVWCCFAFGAACITSINYSFWNENANGNKTKTKKKQKLISFPFLLFHSLLNLRIWIVTLHTIQWNMRQRIQFKPQRNFGMKKCNHVRLIRVIPLFYRSHCHKYHNDMTRAHTIAMVSFAFSDWEHNDNGDDNGNNNNNTKHRVTF